MLLYRPTVYAVPGPAPDRAPAPGALKEEAGLTLIETMISMWLICVLLLGFIAAFVHSRRMTEQSVLQAAATSMIYGIIEQIKQAEYSTQLPSGEVDPAAINLDGSATTPPYIRVRINQNDIAWLRTVYTPVTDEDPLTATPAPLGPAICPPATATAASVGALETSLGSIPLSTVSGTAAQRINLKIWVWVDGIPNSDRDVSEMKRVTVVYTYSFIDGQQIRTIRNSEIFLRSRFDQ